MSYSHIQSPIIADDDEMSRLFEQFFGSPPVASNTAFSGPSSEQTTILPQHDEDLFGDDADASDTVAPVNEVEKENDNNENVDGVKEQIIVTLPEQGTQIASGDGDVLQNLENIHTYDSTLNALSGGTEINYQFPTTTSGNVEYQNTTYGNANSGINYEFPTNGSRSANSQIAMQRDVNFEINHEFSPNGADSSVNYDNDYSLQTYTHENISQAADLQADTLGFESMRYALEPNDFTSYMGNYYFPNDENAVGDVDESSPFPITTDLTHPVALAEESDFGSTGVVQNNDNNVGFLLFLPNLDLISLIAQQYTVIGDHDPIPITDNETIPGQTQAIGYDDNFSLSFPPSTQSNHPVAQGSGLESNGDVQNNDTNDAVVGDNTQIPVVDNNNPALPQPPTNIQGSGGFFILPYYDFSTGQISHVPFPIPLPVGSPTNPAAGDHYPVPITNNNNLAVPDQTPVAGDEDNSSAGSLVPVSHAESNYPVAETSDLENNGVQNNNNNQSAVVGENNETPVTDTTNSTLPQPLASAPGSGGYFILPYYDNSTGQITQAPIPVSAVQEMVQQTNLRPNEMLGPMYLHDSFNASVQQPEFVQGNSRADAIPTTMGVLDSTDPNMNFWASEMSGGDPIQNITAMPSANTRLVPTHPLPLLLPFLHHSDPKDHLKKPTSRLIAPSNVKPDVAHPRPPFIPIPTP
ncbi:hypothetical protein Clacol_008007 [Clathrus columnatus]|uniref:Uncharacterized protein n=1 Tax=Clathrus columnatus TaxID=1419009 RepID=A0AAV5ALE1_9AGAM|nr:hypothetical protein Clacol_008007 [Clathrus columnatus]